MNVLTNLDNAIINNLKYLEIKKYSKMLFCFNYMHIYLVYHIINISVKYIKDILNTTLQYFLLIF